MDHDPPFEILGEIQEICTITTGRGIRDLERLVDRFGPGRWLKRKGVAMVRLPDGTVRIAELHWYEAHGIGRKALKIKRYVEP